MRLRTPTLVIALAAAHACLGCDSPARRDAPGMAAPPPSAAAPAVTATIRLDDAHDMMKKGASYSIAPAAALALDGAGLVLAGDAAGFGRPNAIHVAHGPSESWRATFDGKWPVTLDARSLDPVRGGAFGGFESGEYVVAVGAEGASNDGTMRFAPAWVGTIVVGAR